MADTQMDYYRLGKADVSFSAAEDPRSAPSPLLADRLALALELGRRTPRGFI